MKTLLTLLLLLAAACESPAPTSNKAKSSDFPCNCGTAEAAFHPCLNPVCARGENNPDNPDCACGHMTNGEAPK